MHQHQKGIVRLSNHCDIYRSFSIIRIPRTVTNPITRYRVRQGDQSYGLFDAKGIAIHYIDRLYKMKSNADE
ncbi:hypothetical protein B4923_15475 [Brenneria roseae subsp. americana]|uniref:DUF4761 domain-containing protein n=1 Tax=Brenneria roseae subsp. americana TaxID=1508507 RepID=A0A2U1TND2_9GAMM|nr:hypothetical protein B4923_15475 [Brenneria roseae subsp. americana]